MSLDKLQSPPLEILNTFLVNPCSFQVGKSIKHARAYNASEKSPSKQRLILNQSISEHEIYDILSYIPADLPYFEWVTIGMALHSEGYPLRIWEDWSKKGSSYKPNECARKWQGFTPHKGISLGSLIFTAKQYGYRGRFESYATRFNMKDITMNISEFDGQFSPVIPFDGYDTPNISCDLMPESISSHLKDISHILQVPEALCVLNALGILSACLNGKYKVQVKPDWLEPVNIYAMALLPPASRKSPVFNLLLAEVNEWEQEKRKDILPKLKEYNANIEIIMMKMKNEEKAIKNNQSPKAEENYKKLNDELEKLKNSKPVVPQIYTNDVTPESLARCVYEQNGHIAIISDEGGITETLSGLYSNGNANIDIILKGHDGGSVRISRSDKDYILIPHIVMLLCMQPQILKNMSNRKSFQGNGTFERYIYALPKTNIGYRQEVEQSLNPEYKREYDTLIRNLLNLPYPDLEDKSKIPLLKFEKPAQDAFKTWDREIELMLRPDGALYSCAGWGGKLTGKTARIAAIIHMAENESGNNTNITLETMKKAIALAKLFCKHAVAAYGLTGQDEDTSNAEEIYKWLQTQNAEKLSKSDFLSKFKNRNFGKKEKLDKALEILIERNILSIPYFDDSTAKRTSYYFVNPVIYKN